MSLASDFPTFALARGWEPPVDVYRGDRGWLVKVELAGVRPDEVSVELAGRRLAVSGRRADVVALDATWQRERIEIAYSRFERTMMLPAAAAGARLATEYRDGMLLVYVWCC